MRLHDGDGAVRAHRQELTDRARERHDALTAAIDGLERALVAPAATRARPWSERVESELRHVREQIAAHVDGIEEREGLFDEIEVSEPRLAKRVALLRQEHVVLSAQARALAEELPGAGDDLDFVALRRRIAALLTALRTHRADETDLVYEAFWTDMGAAD